MATDDEKTLLSPRVRQDQGQPEEAPLSPGSPPGSAGTRTKTAMHLQKLVCAGLAAAFKEARVEVPRDLAIGKLPVSGIESRLKELKKKGVSVEVTKTAFAAFRADYEAPSSADFVPIRAPGNQYR